MRPLRLGWRLTRVVLFRDVHGGKLLVYQSFILLAAVTFAPEIVMVAPEIDAAVKVAPEIDAVVAVALEVVTFRGVHGGKL